MLLVQLYLLVGLVLVSIKYKVLVDKELIDNANKNPLFTALDESTKHGALYYVYPCICILFWPAIVIAVICDSFNLVVNKFK